MCLMALYSISSLLKRAVTINPAQLFITVWRELIDLKNWCTPRKTQPCQVFRKILMVTGTNLMLHCRWQPAKESCSLVKAPNDPYKISLCFTAVHQWQWNVGLCWQSNKFEAERPLRHLLNTINKTSGPAWNDLGIYCLMGKWGELKCCLCKWLKKIINMQMQDFWILKICVSIHPLKSPKPPWTSTWNVDLFVTG